MALSRLLQLLQSRKVQDRPCRKWGKLGNKYSNSLSALLGFSSSTDKDSVESGEKKPEQPDMNAKFGSHHIMDLTAATFLDVGVLRCLFITHWQEEGIYWALHFLYNR